MFKTRKSMAHEIEALTNQREYYKRLSALMDAEPLPKCESLVCVSCVNAVFKRDPMGCVHLIGCGYERKCPNYTLDEHFTYDERAQAMRRRNVKGETP